MPEFSREAEFQIRKAERLLADRQERRERLLEAARQAARILRAEYGARRVWLFGSLRRPWFHEGSDVDLAVEGVATERIGHAWDRIAGVVGHAVDLVSLDEAAEGLRRRVLESGEPIDDG